MNKRTRDKLIKIARDFREDAAKAKAKKDMETYHLTIGKMLGILIAFEHDLEEAKEIDLAMKAEKERLEKLIESMRDNPDK